MQFTVPNLKKMAESQEVLDKRIREEHGIDYDTSNQKIIAFKTEFGEFLNENRFFKFWSKNKEPRVHAGFRVLDTNGRFVPTPINPQLEEYVDGIHFLLSIGNERKYIKWIHAIEVAVVHEKNLENLALDVYHNPLNSAGKWLECMTDYLHIGQLVNIHAKDIEEAYLKKNALNHKRQDQGY